VARLSKELAQKPFISERCFDLDQA